MTQRHRKLFSAGERLGAKLFADWYRFGNGKRPAGIVHYVGGAITEDKYRRRRGSRPDAIATHFRAALAANPCYEPTSSKNSTRMDRNEKYSGRDSPYRRQ